MNRLKTKKVLFLLSLLIIGLVETSSFAYTGSQNHRTGLHLQLPERLIDINKSDIEQTQIFQIAPNQASVMIKLRSPCAKRLSKLTEKQIGQPAIWIWNGRVLLTKELQAPLDDDITLYNLTSSEAEEFKKKMSND